MLFTIYCLGCVLLPGAAGAVYGYTRSARATLWLAAVLAFACVPGLLLFRRAQSRANTA